MVKNRESLHRLERGRDRDVSLSKSGDRRGEKESTRDRRAWKQRETKTGISHMEQKAPDDSWTGQQHEESLSIHFFGQAWLRWDQSPQSQKDTSVALQSRNSCTAIWYARRLWGCTCKKCKAREARPAEQRHGTVGIGSHGTACAGAGKGAQPGLLRPAPLCTSPCWLSLHLWHSSAWDKQQGFFHLLPISLFPLQAIRSIFCVSRTFCSF